MTQECRLLIVGGGPAGLTSAIYAGSEGLCPILVDSGITVRNGAKAKIAKTGGQARNSSMIENYAGFPEGITGPDLLDRFDAQARKFAARVLVPAKARAVIADGNRRVVTTDDETFVADVVLLANGLSYTRLQAPGVQDLLGLGVEYGAPQVDPTCLGKASICIVGGANSAGQAAVHFSRNLDMRVHLLVRSSIEKGMSQYLVERIRKCANVSVWEGVEVSEVVGVGKLERVMLKHVSGDTTSLDASRMFIYIGAAPKVAWLGDCVRRDSKNFIVTGPKLVGMGLWNRNRQPLPFETTLPGVFACGDVRLGSVKRVGAAVGEGSAVVSMIHTYLAHNGA